MFKAIFLATFVAACVANTVPAYQPAAAPYKQPAYDAPAAYSFNWLVKDDPSYNNYGQTETRNGDKTDGSYSVLLPDGRVQTVKYYVDGDSGFVAEVSYSGEPKYASS